MNQKTLKFLYYLVFSFLLVIFYTLQTTPGVFEISGVRPVLVVPFVLCIAMLKGEGAGAVYGVIGGLLWDMSSGRILGFSAIILLVCCVSAALLTIYLLRITWFNIILITSATMLVYCTLDYLFFYLIWAYDDSYLILVKKTVPMIAYTALASPAVYFVLNKVNKKFDQE